MPFRAPAPPLGRAATRPRARSGAVANLGRPRAGAFGTLLVVVAVALGCIARAPCVTAADARLTARRALLDHESAGDAGVSRPVRAAVAEPTGQVRGDRATSRASSPFPRRDGKNISRTEKASRQSSPHRVPFPPPASPRRSAPR